MATIQEFNLISDDGRYEGREYDPLEDDVIQHIMDKRAWTREQTITYAERVIKSIEEAGGILKTSAGFLRLKQEGDPSIEEIAQFLSAKQQMPCPNCGTPNTLGEFLLHEDGERHFAAPNDITCESCSITLRHIVPIMAVGPYGWCWKQIEPDKARTEGKPLRGN